MQLAQVMAGQQQAPFSNAPDLMMQYLMKNRQNPMPMDMTAAPSATATPYNPNPMPGNYGGNMAWNTMNKPFGMGGM